MRIEHWGGLKVRITGGADRQGGGDGPLVVLMHGFGAMGDDLVPLSRMMDVDRAVRFVFPEAPHPLPAQFGGFGRAWWPLDAARLERAMQLGKPRDLSDDEPPGVDEVRGKVCALLAELGTHLGARGDQLIVGGFSQGAMLACDVAFRSDVALAGLVALSGTLLNQSVWTPRMPRRAGLPVFQSHGRSDSMLAFGAAEKLKDAMEAAGLRVDWNPFRGGHEIPAAVLGRLEGYLRRVLGEPELEPPV